MLPLTEGGSERHERTGSKTAVVLGASDRERPGWLARMRTAQVQAAARAQIPLLCDSGETPAPIADRALVMDLAGQRPADLGYAAELRASDLPWAHAGKTAEAAGHPRLAMVATGSARHPGGRPDRAPQDGPLLRASRPQLRDQDARRAAAPRAAVLSRRRGAIRPPSWAASGSCPRLGTAPGRTWARASSRR